MKINQNLLVVIILIAATVLESFGDALVRKSIYEYKGIYKGIFMLVGAALLFGYGYTLNLAPMEFGKLVGLYIATLFIVWQVVSYISFKTVPSLSVIVGGSLIVIGGVIVTFAKF